MKLRGDNAIREKGWTEMDLIKSHGIYEENSSHKKSRDGEVRRKRRKDMKEE